MLANTYQLSKYIKHTCPDPRYNVQSVFASPSTQAYQDFIVSSALSGSVEIDDKGRRNVIWVAGKDIGFQYTNGRMQQPEDAVKVVLSTETAKIHAFPQATTTFFQAVCADCGRRILY